ncbi:MAG: DNA recombination protein RmuC, partial [bacterium]|nr:DNA recombination protein RmuC [bacterium]
VGWRQEGVAEQARNVSNAGRELYSQVSTLAEHVTKVGRSLDTTVQDFNAAIGTLEGGVLPGARKLSNLGVPTEPEQLPAVARVKEEVKLPAADQAAKDLRAAV